MAEPRLPDNVQRQIEDALEQGRIDRLPREPSRRPRPRRASPLPDPRPRSPNQLLLIGVVVALIAWFLRPPYAEPLLYVGMVAIGIALVSLLVRPQGQAQRYWRGRPVDLPPHGWPDRLYRLLYRR